MKCPICNGKGYVYNALGSFNEDCGHCQGTGKVRVEGEPMTNEEWLKQANTEQLAEFLTKFILDDKRFRMTMVGGVNETKLWLKQPHTNE